ncbi:MAG: hypothetical protein ACKO3T_12140, partial [Planctomycetaceae bacterium]
GIATITVTTQAVGSFNVTAAYSGDTNYISSTANSSYTVASINFSPLASNIIQRGSSLTLLADITPSTDSRANAPLGSVNFVIPGTTDTLVASVPAAQASNGRYTTTIDTGNPAFNLPVGAYNLVELFDLSSGVVVAGVW